MYLLYLKYLTFHHRFLFILIWKQAAFLKRLRFCKLRLSMKIQLFLVYITPSKSIDEKASQVTGLCMVSGQLQCRGIEVSSVSLSEGLRQFYEFLSTFQKKCFLVAHNCKFDCPRLLTAIDNINFTENYKAIVAGFSDTLPVIKKITGLTGKSENKLEQLAINNKIPSIDAHNAINDIIMLEQLIIKLDVKNHQMLESTLTWNEAVDKKIFNDELPSALQKLHGLDTCTSLATTKKLIVAKMSYNLILETFKNDKLIGLLNLFDEDENGDVRVTKCRKVVKKISDFLETM